MSIRHVVKTFAACSAASICGVAFMLAVGAGPAGADLTNGPTTLSTIGTVASGTPYSSGQTIKVTVAANSTLNNANLVANSTPGQSTGNATGSYVLEECTDPGGLPANLPTAASGCEAATIDTSQSKSIDGSMTDPSYTVYDLPDLVTLGQPTMVGKCDVAPNQCVIGVFAVNPANGGFGFPHIFSAPFQISVGDGADLGDSPGDGTPEVPLAIGIPLAGLAVLGAFTIRHRRRQQQHVA